MNERQYRIRWSLPARFEFKRLIAYVKVDSPKNAEMVKEDILKIVASLARNPERFTPDHFKSNNHGSVRYFEKHRIRISFEVEERFVNIIRCRHTSRKPENY